MPQEGCIAILSDTSTLSLAIAIHSFFIVVRSIIISSILVVAIIITIIIITIVIIIIITPTRFWYPYAFGTPYSSAD